MADYLEYIGLIGLRPRLKPIAEPRKVYGFFASIAVGIGSTIGTSTFVAIPVAVHRYGFATVLGLALDALASALLAVGYSRMFHLVEAGEEGVPVGGPAFVKSAFGNGALYFTARFNLWIANTALSAFNILMFYSFTLHTLPLVLDELNLGRYSTLLVSTLLLSFTLWFIFSLLYRERYSRGFMWFQVALVSLLLLVLFKHAAALIHMRAEQLSLSSGLNEVRAEPWNILFAAAYTYLLMFGFQEIQSISNEMRDEIDIPLASRLSNRFTGVKKSSFAGYAMGATVMVSSAFFMLYAVSVLGLSFNPEGVPAITIALEAMGAREASLMSIAFTSSILTTFVPAYIAASKHLEMLIEDTKLPRRIRKFSWLFTLIAVGMLATSNADFLIKTTDFSVLISMALIALSEVNLSAWLGKRSAAKPIAVSVMFLIVAFSFYLLDIKIVNYGIAYIFIAWFLFTLIKQGNYFVKLFLVATAAITYFLLAPALASGPGITSRLLARLTGFLIIIMGVFTVSIAYDHLKRIDVNQSLKLAKGAAAKALGAMLSKWSRLIRKYRRSRLISSRYKLIDLAIKLESIKEANPELYKRLSTILDSELREIEEQAGARKLQSSS